MRPPGFIAAFTYPFHGLWHLMRTPRLWKLAALPLAINLVVYTALVVLLYVFVRHILVERWLADQSLWLRWGAGIVAGLTGLVLLAFAFTAVGNVVASPFLDFLSERVLLDLRGGPLPPGGPWYLEALGSVGRQLAMLAVFLAIQVALLVLWLIPVVQLLHPVLAGLATIIFLALEYLEYPLAADRATLSARLAYILEHRGATLGFGLALFIVVLIPIVGYLALPSCVVGATQLYHDLGGLRSPQGSRLPGNLP
ncbi:MAG: EI24 domain-containing protein [Planctomycetes bacterium]|nr:EI24 domain-containing protein [Planctomycetota bacterium]